MLLFLSVQMVIWFQRKEKHWKYTIDNMPNLLQSLTIGLLLILGIYYSPSIFSTIILLFVLITIVYIGWKSSK
jgi:hypothetical protein